MSGKRAVRLPFAVALGMLGAVLVAWSALRPTPSAYGLYEPAPPASLNATMRRERAAYWASRYGLQFGVPHGAHAAAVNAMRQAEAARPRNPAAGSPAAAPTSSLAWSFIGPQPIANEQANFGGDLIGPGFAATGRVTAVAADSSHLFVGTANGGLWMSTDGGNTFATLTAQLPTQAVGAIALDSTTTPTTIYLGTGEGNESSDSYYGQGLFVSSDLGTSWQQKGLADFQGYGFTRLAIDVTHTPPYLFAAISYASTASRSDASMTADNFLNDGLWRSTDGGTNWAQVDPTGSIFGCIFPTLGGPCPAEDVVVDPNKPGDVYVGIEYDGVWRSTDSGATWSQAALPGIPAGLN